MNSRSPISKALFTSPSRNAAQARADAAQLSNMRSRLAKHHGEMAQLKDTLAKEKALRTKEAELRRAADARVSETASEGLEKLQRYEKKAKKMTAVAAVCAGVALATSIGEVMMAEGMS